MYTELWFCNGSAKSTFSQQSGTLSVQPANKGMYSTTSLQGYVQYNQLKRVCTVQIGYYMVCKLQLGYLGMYSTTRLLWYVVYN